MPTKFPRSKDAKFVAWAKEVKSRDNYNCKICRVNEAYLNSHHINSWDMFEDLRYDITNGVTLCKECHRRFHDTYGKGRNTFYQYDEWEFFCKMIEKMLRKKILEDK